MVNSHTRDVIRKELEHLSTGQLEQLRQWYVELVHKDDAILREEDICHAVVAGEIIDERARKRRID